MDKAIAPPLGPEELGRLNPYAVIFRYDEMEIETITRDEAETMVKTVRRWAGEQIR